MADKVILGGSALAALALGCLWWQQGQQEAAAAVAPPAAEPMLTTMPVLPKPESGGPDWSKGGLSSGTLATVLGGVQVQNLMGDIAEKVGGKGAGDTARVVQPSLGAGLIIGKGTERLLENAGVPSGVAKYGGLGAGVAFTFGAPAVVGALSLQAAGSGLKAVGGLVIGKEAAQKVSNAVSQFDPLKSGSVANKVVGGVSSAVKKLKFW